MVEVAVLCSGQTGAVLVGVIEVTEAVRRPLAGLVVLNQFQKGGAFDPAVELAGELAQGSHGRHGQTCPGHVIAPVPGSQGNGSPWPELAQKLFYHGHPLGPVGFLIHHLCEKRRSN